MLLFPSAAFAQRGGHEYDLDPVPHQHAASGGSHANGRAKVTVHGDRVRVEVGVHGLSPNLVHVQHIHGVGQNECPGPDARDRRVHDGLIDTVEGLPEYGPIQVSLTTSGDTSPESGLAVERFPVADAHGEVRYDRTFTIGEDFPRHVANHLVTHHVVVHGIDVNHNGEYDFGAGAFWLSPALPLEADLPALCGMEIHHQ